MDGWATGGGWAAGGGWALGVGWNPVITDGILPDKFGILRKQSEECSAVFIFVSVFFYRFRFHFFGYRYRLDVKTKKNPENGSQKSEITVTVFSPNYTDLNKHCPKDPFGMPRLD